MTKTYHITLSILSPLLALSGCGGGGGVDLPSETVQGRVTYQGQAVPEGSNLLLESSQIGVSRTSTIQADGKYQIEDLPIGTYVASVGPAVADPPESEMSEAEYDKMMSGEAPPPEIPATAADYPVPEQYRETSTSDETVEIRSGEQQVDIDFGS